MAAKNTPPKTINPHYPSKTKVTKEHVIPLMENFETTILPQGFPSFLMTEQAWYPSEFSDEERYIYHLSNNDKLELDEALSFFKTLGLDGNLVNKDNFPLPQLQHVLRRLADDLHNGRGFCLIRGLEPGKYCIEDRTVVFLGIQSYIAEKRMRQDEVGNMIVHIISDPSSSRRSTHVRYSTDDIPFHTDPDADILAFDTRSTAASGGRCVISSGHTIYNELAISRPDVIQTLAKPDWPFDLPYFHPRPILFHHNRRILFSFTRLALLGHKFYPRSPSTPSLSACQREALDLLDAVAEKHRLEIATRAGDIHFVNNLALLHRRDRFSDKGFQRRHLIRMHLRSPELGWDIPDALGDFWDAAMDEQREERWYIEPMPEAFFPLKLGSH